MRTFTSENPSLGPPEETRSSIVRNNLLRATVSVISEHGYVHATVTQIARAAGVSRGTFYTAFRNKEDALCAVLSDTCCHTLTTVRAAVSSADAWPEQVYLGLRDLLEFFAHRPQLARMVFVEAQVAGPRAMTIVQAGMRDCTECCDPPRADVPDSTRVSDTLTKQVLGAVYFRIYEAVSAGQSESLPELLAELVEIALVPYIGHQRVTAFLSAHHAP
jgi:AcrR family transcriptional regulator